MMDSDKKDEDWLYDDDADLAIDQEIYDRLHAALDAAGPSGARPHARKPPCSAGTAECLFARCRAKW